MPFRKWIVQPVFLGRNPKPPDKRITDFEFENTTNGTLVKCLHQLGSVLEHADRIFDEIGAECRLVFERADRLTSKIQLCQEAVSKLNARAVKVPVSDLAAARKFVKRHAPYRTEYEQSSQIFLPSNRPRCIDKLYNEACTTPVSVMCAIDGYRTDGCTSSQLFMVTPVLGGTRRKKKKKNMLDIETRKPASFSLAESEQGIRKPGRSLQKTVVSPSTDQDSKLLERLPSPEELTLAVSLDYPSTLVPVDVTGNSFLRMSRCRRSLIHADFEIKRRKSKHKSKRRHTVCEGNNKDLEEAIGNITMVNNSCQTEETNEPSSFFSFRRSFSRRKRITDATRRETIALDGLNIDLTQKDAEITSSSSTQDRTNSAKKESQHGNKKTGKGFLMSKAAKMNPISSLSAAISMAVKMRHSKSSGKQDDGRSSSGNWSASSSTRASIDSDQHHAVVAATDRNSNISRSSAGKDSVLSDATTITTTAPQESVRSQEQSAVTTLEHSKFMYNKTKAQRGNVVWDYDRGRESNASTPERTSDCASTPLVMSPYTNRKNYSNYYAPSAFDDGESSVYSVDTDGYYTSMHTDSGLWNTMKSIKGSEGQTDSVRCRRRQESQSSVSTIDNGSINSFLSKVVTENENSSSCSSLKKEKPAPEPPPRISSCNASVKDIIAAHENSTIQEDKTEYFEKEDSPLKNGSASESDYESRDRIRVKTTINSSRYPSLCAVSPETSDDEDELTEMQQKTKSPVKSIVVAEVHREEVEGDECDPKTSKKRISKKTGDDLPLKNLPKSPPVINMYGGHSPTESTFASSLIENSNVVSSTPKQKASVTSFTSDISEDNKEPPAESPSLVQKLLLDLKRIPNPSKDLIITSPPVSPKTVPQNIEKTLIPLKYAQCITVTPIMRSESLENGKNKINSTVSTPPQRSKSFLKNPLSNLPFRHSENSNSKPKSPSYISFQSPDSPVASSTSLSPELVTAGSPSTKKAVARVTLDPMGKVIFSSSSLDRNKREDHNNFPVVNRNEPKYATLPKYHGSTLSTNLPLMPSSVEATIHTYNELQPACASQTQENKRDNKNLTESQFNSAVPQTIQNNSKSNLLFRPSRGGRFCRTYFPSHIISSVPQICNVSPPPSPASIKSEFSTSSHLSFQNKRQTEHNQCTISPQPSANKYPQSLHTARTMPNQRYSISHTLSQQNSLQRPYVPYTDSSSAGQKHEFISDCKSTVHPMPSAYHFRPVSASQETKFNVPHCVPNLPCSSPRDKLNVPSSRADLPLTANTTDFASTKNFQGVSPLLSSYPYEQMENNGKITEFTPPNPPDVIPSSSTPPSTLDVTARTVKNEGSLLNSEVKPSGDQSSLRSLSSSELFAIIHNSKKKHNIKTDSEKSLSPLSSRSSSPAISMTSSPVKTPKIETGVLTRQNRDHSSTSSPQLGENTSTSDRLGRYKPTSMHDFKMLLLQTRIGGRESIPRPSAAELLKVSPPRGSGQSSPKTLPRMSNSPMSKMQHVPVRTSSPVGHGTIPVKRTNRTRSPYLTRYDSAYPPIWEDCSEDLEAADENQNTVSSFMGSPSPKLPNSEIYATRIHYGKTLLDNEKPNAQATSTWV